MSPYCWSQDKPGRAGICSVGRPTKPDRFIVLVDQAGVFQWPDGGFQEVSLANGEWAGPIEEPQE